MTDDPNTVKPHFTTRRGFIAAAGFGVVGLYGLWAAYGAAPLHIFGMSGDHAGPDGHAARGAHGAHGSPSGSSPAEFRKVVEHFAEVHRQPDGSIWPRPVAADHAHHGAAEHAVATGEQAGEPIDVYLMAYQWGFTPNRLRLDVNALYRFRMMAVDVTHGAAIRISAGSRITRLRTGALVEQDLQFKRPGEYLVYCTVYCGMLHDRMRGTIIVA